MLAVLLMLGLGACGVDASPGGASTPVVPVARAESVPAGAGGHTSERPERRSDPRRVVAIGDVHGDLAAGLAALRSAALIDAASPLERWPDRHGPGG
jgi:hypothetical protein